MCVNETSVIECSVGIPENGREKSFDGGREKVSEFLPVCPRCSLSFPPAGHLVEGKPKSVAGRVQAAKNERGQAPTGHLRDVAAGEPGLCCGGGVAGGVIDGGGGGGGVSYSLKMVPRQ